MTWQRASVNSDGQEDRDCLQGPVHIPWCSTNAGGLNREGRWLIGGWLGPAGGSTPDGNARTLTAEKLRFLNLCSWVTFRGHFSLFFASFFLMRFPSPLLTRVPFDKTPFPFLDIAWSYFFFFFWQEQLNGKEHYLCEKRKQFLYTPFKLSCFPH